MLGGCLYGRQDVLTKDLMKVRMDGRLTGRMYRLKGRRMVGR